MAYRCVATSVAGFVQQLAVACLAHGYWFYVVGRVPPGKDPADVDRKLINRYAIDQSKWPRARAKRAGRARVRYLRFDRYFILMATRGEHPFFAEKGKQFGMSAAARSCLEGTRSAAERDVAPTLAFVGPDRTSPVSGTEGRVRVVGLRRGGGPDPEPRPARVRAGRRGARSTWADPPGHQLGLRSLPPTGIPRRDRAEFAPRPRSRPVPRMTPMGGRASDGEARRAARLRRTTKRIASETPAFRGERLPEPGSRLAPWLPVPHPETCRRRP